LLTGDSWCVAPSATGGPEIRALAYRVLKRFVTAGTQTSARPSSVVISENIAMRISCVLLVALALAGCGEIDANRSAPVVDRDAPAAPTTGEAARTPATPADNTARDGDKTPPPGTEPTNTGVNVRDTDRVTRDPKLPIDQKENQADIDVTAKIRQRILETEGMSVNARNAKIITADGKVTLRGPVESDQERETIGRIAQEVAGAGNVENHLEVTPADVSKNTSKTSPQPR
jgi:hyperosmotically inducible periplasmic protein